MRCACHRFSTHSTAPLLTTAKTSDWQYNQSRRQHRTQRWLGAAMQADAAPDSLVQLLHHDDVVPACERRPLRCTFTSRNHCFDLGFLAITAENGIGRGRSCCCCCRLLLLFQRPLHSCTQMQTKALHSGCHLCLCFPTFPLSCKTNGSGQRMLKNLNLPSRYVVARRSSASAARRAFRSLSSRGSANAFDSARP
jgi:hypothetical protein